MFSNSYPTQNSGNNGGGYGGGRRQNPYAQQDDNPSYEMSDVKDSTTNLTAGMTTMAGGDSMNAFYDEVRQISSSLPDSFAERVALDVDRFHSRQPQDLQ